VVMEATSDSWKGVCYLLEAAGLEVWLVNARDVRHLPGRPRPTPWMRSGGASLPSGSCCGPASCHTGDPAAAAGDPLPGRPGRGADRRAAAGRAGCRVDAQIKRSVVASDSFGVSGRAMLAALIAGERNPKLLAQLARGRMRANLGPLAEAFCGHFTDQHGFLLAKLLARVAALDADLAELDGKLEELIVPFAAAVERLDAICGVGRTAAQVIPAEVGTDMTRFPTAGQLASWAKFPLGQGIGRQEEGQERSRARQPLPGSGARGGRRGRQQDRHLPWPSAPGGSPAAAVPSGPSWRSAAPSWSSSGTRWPTQKPTSTTWAPASTTPASTLSGPSATTSASSRRSAPRSPSNPPPEPAPILPCLDPAPLRRAGCCPCRPGIFGSVEVSLGGAARA
jgi:hypothetical protein